MRETVIFKVTISYISRFETFIFHIFGVQGWLHFSFLDFTAVKRYIIEKSSHSYRAQFLWVDLILPPMVQGSKTSPTNQIQLIN